MLSIACRKRFRFAQVTKNLLSLSGLTLSWLLTDDQAITSHYGSQLLNYIGVFISCCLIATWNYVLNDFCDSDGDQWHPEKSHRTSNGAAKTCWLKLLVPGVILLAGAFAIVWIGKLGEAVAVVLGLFVISGLIYNVPPFRLKRFPFVDVMTEALNFPIRLALGWYAMLPEGLLPPLSAMLSIWAFGGVLLTGKRAAELARIGDAKTAHAYRPALLHYTQERALVVSSLYGMIMLFSAGVLFAVYPPLHNLIFLLPFILWLMGIYLWKLADGGIAARELEPEKLLQRPVVWVSGVALGALAILLAILPYDLTAWLGFFGGSMK